MIEFVHLREQAGELQPWLGMQPDTATRTAVRQPKDIPHSCCG